MNVQPISFINYSGIKNRSINNRTKPVNVRQSQDSVSFTAFNYDTALKNMTKAKLFRESTVESYFKILMNNISEDGRIIQTPMFQALKNIYQKKGLRSMLLELWNPYPSAEINDIVGRFGEDFTMTLGVKRTKNVLSIFGEDVRYSAEEPVIELLNWGKHGFWNNILNRKEAPNDIRLLFSNGAKTAPKRKAVELCVNKKGDLMVSQQNNEYEVITTYYPLTGHRKSTVETYGECSPYRVYYNKDGTKAFWKNILSGGVQIEPIY